MRANGESLSVFEKMSVLTAIAIAGVYLYRAELIFGIDSALSGLKAEDTIAFWTAAKMALSGAAASLYDAEAFRSSVSLEQTNLLWLNPPHFLLALAPLGLAPYAVTKFIWIGASLAALAYIARVLRLGRTGAACLFLSPAVYVSLFIMQSAPFVAAGLVFALLNAQRHPIASGLVLALLTMKPQYGLLIPIYLAAAGYWRTIGWASLFSVALIALSVLFYGIAPWANFIESLQTTHGENAMRLHQGSLIVQQTLGKLGAPEALRIAGQAAAMAIAAAFAWRVARKDAPAVQKIAVMLALTLVAAPSAWVYDWLLAAIAILVWAGQREFKNLPLNAFASIAWTAPIFALGDQSTMNGLIAPLSLYGLTALLIFNAQVLFSQQQRILATGRAA